MSYLCVACGEEMGWPVRKCPRCLSPQPRIAECPLPGNTSYVNRKCGCLKCLHISVVQREKRRMRPPVFVETDEAKRHIKWLMSKGMTIREISDRSKNTKTTIWSISVGRVSKSRGDCVQRILAVNTSDGVTPRYMNPTKYVDAKPIATYLSHLHQNGVTWGALGIATGINQNSFHRIAVGQRKDVLRTTAIAIFEHGPRLLSEVSRKPQHAS